MKCPNDGAVLTMSERGGVEIDYCPECRGVWLDRGELDKILDRAAAETPAAPPPAAPAPAAPPPEYRQQRYQEPSGYSSGGSHYQGRRPKKKEHWLSELFD
jgi:Zn-finger nucleic acid-binding protein